MVEVRGESPGEDSTSGAEVMTGKADRSEEARLVRVVQALHPVDRRHLLASFVGGALAFDKLQSAFSEDLIGKLSVGAVGEADALWHAAVNLVEAPRCLSVFVAERSLVKRSDLIPGFKLSVEFPEPLLEGEDRPGDELPLLLPGLQKSLDVVGWSVAVLVNFNIHRSTPSRGCGG